MTKTVSLETAKALKEAGWEQGETERTFCPEEDCAETLPVYETEGGYCQSCSLASTTGIAAPDVSELLEALPIEFRLWKGLKESGKNVYLCYPLNLKDFDFNSQPHESPAEALALLWLELRKRKLV